MTFSQCKTQSSLQSRDYLFYCLWSCCSPYVSQTAAYTAAPWIPVCVYSSSFQLVLISPTHRRMVQAEYSWVPGAGASKMVTHPGIIRAWCRVTTLIKTNVILPSKTNNQTSKHTNLIALKFLTGKHLQPSSPVYLKGLILGRTREHSCKKYEEPTLA